LLSQSRPIRLGCGPEGGEDPQHDCVVLTQQSFRATSVLAATRLTSEQDSAVVRDVSAMRPP